MSRQIPWARIMAEGAVIIVSILLALTADAWWDRSSERRTLEDALESLVSEVEIGRVELSIAVDDNQSRLSRYELFLSLDPEQLLALPSDSLQAIGWSFFPPRTFDPGGSALQNLLLGGNLNAIRDTGLRSAVLAWARFPDEIDDDYRISTEVTLALRQRFSAEGMYPALLSLEQTPVIPDAPSLGQALAAMRRDSDVVGVVAELILAYQDFTNQLAEGLDLADQLITLASR